MEESRGVYKVLVGKPEGKRPLGRPMHYWEYNINADLQEMVGRGKGTLDIRHRDFAVEVVYTRHANLFSPFLLLPLPNPGPL
jgi:hypothetical protein